MAVAVGQGGGTALTAGVSVAINDIENQVRAVIDGSTVTVPSNVELTATSSATIDAFTIAVADRRFRRRREGFHVRWGRCGFGQHHQEYGSSSYIERQYGHDFEHWVCDLDSWRHL